MDRGDRKDHQPGGPGGPGPGARIRAELRPDEQLVWAGGPIPARAAFHATPLMAFGLVFATIAGAALAGKLPGRAGAGHWIFGAAGVALATAPYWAHRRARETAYAVTTTRALIVEPSFPSGFLVRSYPPDRLQFLERRDSFFEPPAGDLIFERYRAANRFGHQVDVRRGFSNLEDAHAVEALIRSTLPAQRGPHEPERAGRPR